MARQGLQAITVLRLDAFSIPDNACLSEERPQDRRGNTLPTAIVSSDLLVQTASMKLLEWI